MATFTALQARDTYPVYKPAGRGELATVPASYNITATLAASDVIQLLRIPAGATIVGGWLNASDIDTGTGVFSISLGWAANGVEAANPTGLLPATVVNGTAVANYIGAGIMLPFQGALIATGMPTFTRETIIQLLCNVAPNAFTAGWINCVVLYVTL